MREPDFFIIGAPKCGTTSLAQYLSEHEQIFMSVPKEPHYFNTDFENRYTKDIETYRSYFTYANASHVAIGEASVMYLFSKVAVQNILKQIPEARFIVMVRSPIEIASALHSQALMNMDETIPSFEKAWQMQDERRLTGKVPRQCKEVKMLMYGEIARVGEQVQRLYEQVDQSRIKIIFMDDLKVSPRLVYRETLGFLGVGDDGREHFPVINENRSVRSYFVKNLVDQVDVIKRILRINKGLGLKKRIKASNQKITKRDPVEMKFEQELLEFFVDDIKKLEQITERDLSSWLSQSK